MRPRPLISVIAGICSSAALLFAAAGTQAVGSKRLTKPTDEFAAQVYPLVKKFCVGCHQGKTAPAAVALESFKTRESVLKARGIWERVAQNVAGGTMPPMKAPQPTQAQRDLITSWIESTFSKLDCDLHNPGKVTLRRLNRAEYNNTIRDLLGIDFKPAESFPLDDSGYGFDNIGDVLSLSPLLMEKYLSAAEKITAAVWAKPELKEKVFKITASDTDLDAVARKSLGEFARKAYRRPVTKAEVDRLLRFVELAKKQGDDFDRGMQLAVQAALVSPNFLFRAEKNSPGARLLDGYEMASRLSYFLWCSTPDEALYQLAARNELQKPEVLAAQVKRMLADPKARALTDNFAAQWLTLRLLQNCSPNPKQFPQWDESLRTAMRTETEMFFNNIVQEDRSVVDILNCNYTFLNEKLANLYGIQGVEGEQFRKVTLAGDQRGGVLTQASILTLTSNPTRTSPVKRGKWVLENLLGTPPPPPPPAVPLLPDEKHEQLTGTLRQRMEQHRKDPACANCHARLDPLGFGLENFDAIGAWRTKDGDADIDSSGTLPGNKTFKGPAELKQILLGKKSQFVKCVAEKLLTFGLGRGLESYDKCALDGIVRQAAKTNFRFSSLVIGVVESEPFRKRKG